MNAILSMFLLLIPSLALAQVHEVEKFSEASTKGAGVYILKAGSYSEADGAVTARVYVANFLTQSIFIEDHVLEAELSEVRPHTDKNALGGLPASHARPMQERTIHLAKAILSESGAILIESVVPLKVNLADGSAAYIPRVRPDQAKPTFRLRGRLRWYATEDKEWQQDWIEVQLLPE